MTLTLQKQYFKSYFVKLVIMNELCIHKSIHGASLVTHMVKESSCNVGDPGSIPGLGRLPGEGMATHSSILVWKIPWTEEPGGYSPRGPQHESPKSPQHD